MPGIFLASEYRLPAYYADGALAIESPEYCTSVRITALLTTVPRQHLGNKRNCNIGPTTIDGVERLANVQTKMKTAAFFTSVQAQDHENDGCYIIRLTMTNAGGRLKDVRTQGMSLLSTPSKINTVGRRGTSTSSQW